MKTCCKCGVEKDESEFYRTGGKRSPDALKRECKECTKNRTAKTNASKGGRQYHTLAEWREKIGNNRVTGVNRKRSICKVCGSLFVNKSQRKTCGNTECLLWWHRQMELEYPQDEWSKASRNAIRKLKREAKEVDEWTLRTMNAATSLKQRSRIVRGKGRGRHPQAK